MFIKISEQPSLYNDLEKKSVHEILVDINREDQKVALAIQKTIPQIEKLVTQIVPRMKQGGRIFLHGCRYKRTPWRARRFRNSTDIRHASNIGYRPDSRW